MDFAALVFSAVAVIVSMFGAKFAYDQAKATRGQLEHQMRIAYEARTPRLAAAWADDYKTCFTLANFGPVDLVTVEGASYSASIETDKGKRQVALAVGAEVRMQFRGRSRDVVEIRCRSTDGETWEVACLIREDWRPSGGYLGLR